jgi:hypothetical protein
MEMDASNIGGHTDIPLDQLDQFLGQTSKLYDVIGLDRRDDETLSRAQKACLFAIAMKNLRHLCTIASTDELKRHVYDRVSILWNKNIQEMMECYS